jgi:glucokinase-like ROK family protein
MAAARYQSRETILDIVRITPGGVSRSQLAHDLGVSRAAITGLVNDLLSRQVLREVGSRSSNGGRRRTMLDVNPQAGRLLGIDIGATHVTLVLTDLAAQVLGEIESPWPIERGPEACLQQLDRLGRDLQRRSGGRLESPLRVIGAGVPGPVSEGQGLVTAPPIMPGWHGFPIRERMQALWGKPVRLLNDADLGALGEHAFGAARGLQDMVYIKVGTGIGAGFLLGGHVYLGATGAAGEIGHITLDPEGPLCTCGNRGCLEAMAGGAALARRAIQAIRAGTPTVLAHHAPLESLTARDIGEAAHRGDHMSQQLLADAGRLIGISAATLVNLVNPQMLVVGGGVAQVGDLLLSPIRDAVRRRSLRASAEVVQVQAALLGRRSTAMGAVALAQHHAVRMLAGCPT